MTWYNVFVLVILLFINVSFPTIWIRAREFSHGTVMAAILVLAILDVVYVAALHAGGFW